MQSDEELFKTTPQTTPQKRQQPKPRPNDNDNNDSPQTKKSKRSGTLGPIPTTYESASEADKTLLRMKDVGGSSWADINSAVREITGVQVGGSTLAVRYARIKANMQVFEKSDELILLQSKKDIEDRFDVEKWQKISEAIESKSGNKYSAAAVQKKFKEMAKRGNGSGVQTEE